MDFLSMSDTELKSYLEGRDFLEDPNADGTECYHRLFAFSKNFVATDGVANMCENLKCYWINDVIGSYLVTKRFSGSFYVAAFVINEDSTCDFILHDGNYNIKIHQHIPYTDLKENLKLFFCYDGTYWVLMLPSEY